LPPVRALVIAVVLASLFALGAPAAAEAPEELQLPTHGQVEGVAIDPADLPITDLDEGRGTRRPSGFWTGYKPAREGAYRWALLTVAIGTIALTGTILFVALRRISRKRAAAATS
jgi:hypothetical protein